MKQVFEKLVVSLSFGLVFCLHIYFALLVGTKPAFAADDSEVTTLKVGILGAETVVKDKKTGNTTKVSVADKKSEGADTVNNSSAVSEDESSEDDGSVSIKINEEDGITFKGSQRLVDKLKKLEDKLEAKMEEREDVVESSIGRTLENVLVPIMIFALAFGFAGYVVYSKQRTRKEYLETIRALAQNNQPIPQELLANLNSNAVGFNNKITNMDYSNPGAIHGMKYLFIGGGIVGFMLLKEISTAAAWGFIFVTMGGYHMVKAHLLQKHAEAAKIATAATPTVVDPAAVKSPEASAQNPTAPQL